MVSGLESTIGSGGLGFQQPSGGLGPAYVCHSGLFAISDSSVTLCSSTRHASYKRLDEAPNESNGILRHIVLSSASNYLLGNYDVVEQPRDRLRCVRVEEQCRSETSQEKKCKLNLESLSSNPQCMSIA
ncbi:hypothetical protein BRADI_4g25136v3 [Brachypodium distachyon]|uniref:Uncharacterized protein n=1 Tax=Brachypodium distachyon TaxID=15368 RepID=A0A0Q3LA11_BRADI|nr:hypothetical protein BRADI_4g25136v3 [Brachypodium distachyon]